MGNEIFTVSPQGPDLVLATDIPYRKGDVFVFDSFNVEADSWDCSDNFTKLELVSRRGKGSVGTMKAV